MKRFFDILLSGGSIIVLAPLLIPVVIILLLTGEHYVFYTQTRIGKGGKTFGLLKFATMLKDSPNLGTKDITIKNDPRVLPFGRFLRKTKINELPQLFNVFLGDMSIIGPRPLTPTNYSYYSQKGQESIAKMHPGLSGIASVVFRDEEKMISKSTLNSVDFYKLYIAPYKEELEIWYFNHCNLAVDFLIIFLTVLVVSFPSPQLPYIFFKTLPPKPSWME